MIKCEEFGPSHGYIAHHFIYNETETKKKNKPKQNENNPQNLP